MTRKDQRIKGFQRKRHKEPSATYWTNMVAGEFMIDLQDFLYSRSDRVRPEQFSREYAGHEREANYFLEKIKKALPDNEEYRYLFIQLDDHLTAKEVESNLLFYRQGFSDGVRLIMQTMMMNGL